MNASRPRDAVAAQVLYDTGAYSTSLVGLKAVDFEYSWSKDTVQTLTVNLNILDSCGSALTIPAGSFTLSVPSMNTEHNANPALTATVGSPNFCTYSVNFISAYSTTRPGDTNNYKDNSVWVWNEK